MEQSHKVDLSAPAAAWPAPGTVIVPTNQIQAQNGDGPSGHTGSALGALIGYARVSTTGQSLTIQEAALLAAGCQRLFREKLSGKRDDRPQLAACLEYIREGDTLVITRIDRLARSTKHLCELADQLQRKGVHFRVLEQALDTTTPTGMLTFHILAAIAEFEHALRAERQMEGIAQRRLEGQTLGRLPALPLQAQEELRERYAAGWSWKVLLQMYPISKTTLYRYIHQGQTRPAPPETGEKQR